MTVGQRRAWLALEEQKRRRKRAAAQSAPADPVPAILLASDGHGRLSWTLNFTSTYGGVNIYTSADGLTWPGDAYDGSDLATSNRDCSGSVGFFRVCVCDDNGADVPPYSNAVYSDGL
jgi:hypothetical protein